MNDKPSKTSGYLRLLFQLSIAPQRSLSEARIKELLGSKSKSTWHRQLAELVDGCKDFPPLLIQSKNAEDETLYKFSTDGWQAFLDAQIEGKYLLECYRQMGHLIESEFANMVFIKDDVERKDIEKVSRKFLNLVKIKARKTQHSREILDSIIEALVSEKQIEITYDGGLRTINPYTLCQHRDNLYLMGLRSKDNSEWEMKTFNLSRITQVKILKTSFDYPNRSKWDPAKEYANSSGLVLGEEKLVQISVTGHARKIFSEKDFFGAQLINSHKDFDIYSCRYTNSHEFLGQIFVYADEVEILNDEELKSEFCRKAERALMKNQRKAA